MGQAARCPLLGGDIPVFGSGNPLHLPAEEIGVEFAGSLLLIAEDLEVDYGRHKSRYIFRPIEISPSKTAVLLDYRSRINVPDDPKT